MRYDFKNTSAPPEEYAHASGERRATRRARRGRPVLTVAALLVAAAMCVALLLARARITALRDECDTLADRITALADENARLTIEYEGMYSLEEIEDYARNVLGMVPGE